MPIPKNPEALTPFAVQRLLGKQSLGELGAFRRFLSKMGVPIPLDVSPTFERTERDELLQRGRVQQQYARVTGDATHYAGLELFNATTAKQNCLVTSIRVAPTSAIAGALIYIGYNRSGAVSPGATAIAFPVNAVNLRPPGNPELEDGYQLDPTLAGAPYTLFRTAPAFPVAASQEYPADGRVVTGPNDPLEINCGTRGGFLYELSPGTGLVIIASAFSTTLDIAIEWASVDPKVYP